VVSQNSQSFIFSQIFADFRADIANTNSLILTFCENLH